MAAQENNNFCKVCPFHFHSLLLLFFSQGFLYSTLQLFFHVVQTSTIFLLLIPLFFFCALITFISFNYFKQGRGGIKETKFFTNALFFFRSIFSFMTLFPHIFQPNLYQNRCIYSLQNALFHSPQHSSAVLHFLEILLQCRFGDLYF